MEQQIIDFKHSEMNAETADLENREIQIPESNELGHNAASETLNAVTRLTTGIVTATDPSREIDDSIAHAAGEGYRFRNRLISESQEFSDMQRLRASYDNDLFLRDQVSFEIEKRNTVRESKAKAVGSVVLKVGGGILLGGVGVAAGAWGFSVITDTIRGDDDDDD